MLQLPTRVSVSLKTVTFALLVGALALTPLFDLGALARGKVINAPASASITDRELFYGDGLGGYSNGQQGVTATLYYNSGDLVLQLGSTRRINVTFTNPMQLTSSSLQDGAPSGSSTAAGTLYIEGLGLIPTGETHVKVMRLDGFSGLPNHVIAYREVTNAGTVINGTPVCATRTARDSWTVVSSSDGLCEPGAVGGQPVPGQVAGMFTNTLVKGKSKHTFVARYVLPFSLTVNCLGDCPPDARP